MVNNQYLSQILTARTCFTPEGDLIVSASNKLPFGKEPTDKRFTDSKCYPSEAIRAVSQQSGTNVIDIDFEIIGRMMQTQR